MMRERLEILARDLCGSSMLVGSREGEWVEVNGVKVTHPFAGVANASYDQCVSTEVYESYLAMRELFSDRELPDEWRAFVAEVGQVRERAGCSYPVDLITGVIFTQLENQERFKELGLEDLKSEDDLDLRDKERVKRIVNGVLGDPVLRDKLRQTMTYLVPDVSYNALWSEELALVLDDLCQVSGVVVDMGCGTGRETVRLAERFMVVGLDWQYHARWYDGHWKSGEAGFARSDIRSAPLPDGVAKAVVMSHVVPHINGALVDVLCEARRLLNEGGILAVGPQEFNSWVFYRKSNGGFIEVEGTGEGRFI